jgi:histidinol-phosphatase (PHP family)
MIPDYHTHTYLSDGKSSHESYLHNAAAKGITELGFTDHISILPSSWTMKDKDVSQMKEIIRSLKDTTTLPVNVKFGIEIDYIPGKEKEIKQLTESLPFDYVIGSVHFLGDWNFDTSPDDFEGKDIDELYEQYFHQVIKASESGLYDIIGHLDLIKKFGHFPKKTPAKLYKKVIKSLQKADRTVELNTNGLNKPCKEMYPSKELLEACYKANIAVTLSSDAHHADEVGQYFSKAIELLKSIGYRKIAVFDQRERRFENLI